MINSWVMGVLEMHGCARNAYVNLIFEHKRNIKNIFVVTLQAFEICWEKSALRPITIFSWQWWSHHKCKAEKQSGHSRLKAKYTKKKGMYKFVHNLLYLEICKKYRKTPHAV